MMLADEIVYESLAGGVAAAEEVGELALPVSRKWAASSKVSSASDQLLAFEPSRRNALRASAFADYAAFAVWGDECTLQIQLRKSS